MLAQKSPSIFSPTYPGRPDGENPLIPDNCHGSRVVWRGARGDATAELAKATKVAAAAVEKYIIGLGSFSTCDIARCLDAEATVGKMLWYESE